MSEQLTVLFEQLRGTQPPAPFASPQQVRRRGRQRNHRQALAAGSAVLAVAGMGAGWAVGVAGQPTPTPPPTPVSPSTGLPSASPTTPPLTVDPPSVPASRLLRPADFTAVDGVTTSELEDRGPNGPGWPWLTVVDQCPDYRAEDYPTVSARHDARGLSYSNGTWLSWQIVESYPDAAANLADVRRLIATCPAYQYPGGAQIQQTLVTERFAGDDSLLVRIQRDAAIDYMVVVRVGALVATLMYDDATEAEARNMAPAMVARLG